MSLRRVHTWRMHNAPPTLAAGPAACGPCWFANSNACTETQASRRRQAAAHLLARSSFTLHKRVGSGTLPPLSPGGCGITGEAQAPGCRGALTRLSPRPMHSAPGVAAEEAIALPRAASPPVAGLSPPRKLASCFAGDVAPPSAASPPAADGCQRRVSCDGLDLARPQLRTASVLAAVSPMVGGLHD